MTSITLWQKHPRIVTVNPSDGVWTVAVKNDTKSRCIYPADIVSKEGHRSHYQTLGDLIGEAHCSILREIEDRAACIRAWAGEEHSQ